VFGDDLEDPQRRQRALHHVGHWLRCLLEQLVPKLDKAID
jgi:hypothetical protein